jgi:hypothetical protein
MLKNQMKNSSPIKSTINENFINEFILSKTTQRFIQEKYIVFFVVLLLFVSCSNEKKNIWITQALNNIETITDIKEFTPYRFYKQPYIYLFDNYLLVYSPLSSDAKVDIYDKRTFKYLISTGVKGEGPGEITAPGPISIDVKNECFWLCDYGKMQMYRFPVDSVFKTKYYKPSFSYKLPLGTGFGEFFFTHPDTIITNPMQLTGDDAMQVMIKKICIKNQSIVPTNYRIPEKIKSNNYYGGWMNLYGAQNCNTMVCTFTFSDLIMFMDKNGNILKAVQGPKGLSKLDDPNSHVECELAYSQVTGNDTYIFALFNGNKQDKSGNMMGSSGRFIRIFSVNGEYIKTLELEDNLANICYDSENKRIIAISNDRENSLIYFSIEL